MNKNFNRFISNPLAQTFLIYISGGWIVLEMTDYFISNYGLTERFRDILLIIMIIGLPVALFLTWQFGREKKEADQKDNRLFKVLLKRPWFSIPAVLVLGLLLFTAVRYVYQHNDRIADRQTTYSNIDDLMKRTGAEISLAVLPFTNFTGDPDQEWLVSGLHETLINELSKISQVRPLRVISRSTVNAFKNYDRSIPELAKEIDVEYLVEASVMGSVDSITLQLRLIQVHPEESVVLAQTSTINFNNILKLHNDIAGQIAQKINLDFSPKDQDMLSASREVNPESYKAYLRGMYHIHQQTPESMEQGLEYLHEAVRLDPAEPFAYAGLALGYSQIAHGPLDPGDALTKAEAAAAQAFKLDTTMAEIYAALAEVYLYGTWEFEKAEKYFIKALELNPNLALTHYHYAWALYLFDRMEEAIAEHKLAVKYDPFNAYFTAWLGGLYFYDGQYEAAIMEVEKSFKIQEDNGVGYYILGESYLAMGNTEEAIDAHEKLVEIYPWWKWALGCTYARTGHISEAEKILDDLERAQINGFIASGIAKINASLDRKDEVIRWLSFEPHHGTLAWAAVVPGYNNLHGDPRFEEFVKSLNIPD